MAEKMITLGKRGDLHAHRQAIAFLRSKTVVHHLFADVAPRFEERRGRVHADRQARPAPGGRGGDGLPRVRRLAAPGYRATAYRRVRRTSHDPSRPVRTARPGRLGRPHGRHADRPRDDGFASNIVVTSRAALRPAGPRRASPRAGSRADRRPRGRARAAPVRARARSPARPPRSHDRVVGRRRRLDHADRVPVRRRRDRLRDRRHRPPTTASTRLDPVFRPACAAGFELADEEAT